MKPMVKLAAAMLLTLLPAAAPAQPRAMPMFDHVAINAANQQKSMDFYIGAFGLTEIPSPFPPGGPRWLQLGGGVSLHVQSLAEKPAPPPRSVHFAIAVADLEAVIGYLDAHRMAWTDARGMKSKVQATRTDGVRQIYTQDPDGYWVEVNDKLKMR